MPSMRSLTVGSSDGVPSSADVVFWARTLVVIHIAHGTFLFFISPRDFFSLAREPASLSGMTRPILEMKCGQSGCGENLAGAEIVGCGEWGTSARGEPAGDFVFGDSGDQAHDSRLHRVEIEADGHFLAEGGDPRLTGREFAGQFRTQPREEHSRICQDLFPPSFATRRDALQVQLRGGRSEEHTSELQS